MPDISWWNEQYAEHDLWYAIEEFIESLGRINESEEATEDQQRILDLTLERLTHLKGRRDADPLLVTQDMLNQAYTSLTPHQRYNDQLQYLNNVAADVENTVKIMSAWPAKRDAVARGVLQQIREESNAALSRFEEVQQGIVDARTSMKELEEQHSTKVSELDTEIRGLIETLRTEAREALTEAESAITATANDLQRDQTLLQKQLASLEQTITAQTNKIQDAHTNQVQEFATFKSTLEDEADAIKEAAEANYAALEDRLTQRYQASRARLDQSIEQVDALVAAAGGSATATNYGEYADSQKTRSDILLAVAAGLVVVAVGVVVWAFSYLDTIGDTSMQNLIFKSSLSLPVVAIAWVMVKEATRHRNTSTAAKDMQLRLLAFEPFLADVEADKKEELRLQMVRQLFIDSGLGFSLPAIEDGNKK